MLVQLEGSSPKSVGTTDPAFQGGTDPEWNERLNNELELFFDASLHEKEAVLTVEVYSDETGDDLIGTGQINVAKVARNQIKCAYRPSICGSATCLSNLQHSFRFHCCT